jgi:hypothetical protein
MTFLPVNQFVTYIEGFDISILRANTESIRYLVEANSILIPSYAFNHCARHAATKKGDCHGFIFVRRCGAEVVPMPLKVIVLVPLEKESMDLRHIPPAPD